MGYFDRWKKAMSSAIKTFRQAFNDVQNQVEIDFMVRSDLYEKRWQYYNNTAYLDLQKWRMEKGAGGLYRFHRQIYNPTYRLVEFYVSSIYPGILSTDALRIPDGTPLAIPLASDTPREIRDALGILWEWSNWQDNKDVFVRYGAAVGDVMVKVVDDAAKQKVLFEVVWPGLVKEIDLDISGNVKSYVLEYQIQDADGRTRTYTEAVDGDSYTYLLDNAPYDPYGLGSSYPNPYGFVPAVWWRFNNVGSVYGAPANWASIPKIDGLNDIVSQIADQVEKVLVSPILISGASSIKPLSNAASSRTQGGFTDEWVQPQAQRYTLGVLTAPEGARLEMLTMDVEQAVALAQKLLAEIEADFPEVTMYRDVREMTQTTGPAVDRLAGDVKNRFTNKAASADVQCKKLFQMGLAIAGWRETLTWRLRDDKRDKFAPFDLNSYLEGALDFDIDMRPPMPYGRGEYYQILNSKGLAIQALKAAGIPLETILRDEGWDDIRLKEMIAQMEGPLAKKVQEIAQEKMTADVSTAGMGGAANATTTDVTAT